MNIVVNRSDAELLKLSLLLFLDVDDDASQSETAHLSNNLEFDC